MFNTNKFILVTRENMEEILKEQQFQLYGNQVKYGWASGFKGEINPVSCRFEYRNLDCHMS